ncbi:MAG TPA: hypothetical protein VF582_00140 [Allosphingosinicella sp.]|jgi:hypothetical protein
MNRDKQGHATDADAAGGAEGGMGEGSAGGPGEGNSLQDASDEAVSEAEERRDGTGHAGAGDIG